MLAYFEVRFHARTQFGIERVIDVIRDFSPNFEAANLNHHRHMVDAGNPKLLHLAKTRALLFYTRPFL